MKIALIIWLILNFACTVLYIWVFPYRRVFIGLQERNKPMRRIYIILIISALANIIATRVFLNGEQAGDFIFFPGLAVFAAPLIGNAAFNYAAAIRRKRLVRLGINTGGWKYTSGAKKIVCRY